MDKFTVAIKGIIRERTFVDIALLYVSIAINEDIHFQNSTSRVHHASHYESNSLHTKLQLINTKFLAHVARHLYLYHHGIANH